MHTHSYIHMYTAGHVKKEEKHQGNFNLVWLLQLQVDWSEHELAPPSEVTG